jgi:hypothetical protein
MLIRLIACRPEHVVAIVQMPELPGLAFFGAERKYNRELPTDMAVERHLENSRHRTKRTAVHLLKFSSQYLQFLGTQLHTDLVVPQKTAIRSVFDELRRRAELALEHVQHDWLVYSRIRPLAITWVSEQIEDDRGVPIGDTVLCLLPDNRAQHDRILHEMVERTKAAALMVIRQTGDDIKAVYETPIGSASWDYRIEDRGDRKMPILRSTHSNRDHIGMLWQPS